VRDPDDHTAQQPTETLQGGPTRPPFLRKVPTRWRRHAAALLGFVLGIAAGGGAVLWWQADPEPSAGPVVPPRVDEHAVELVLFDAVQTGPNPPGGASDVRPLRVDSAFLLSGAIASTVFRIDNPEHGLEIRAPALPVTVSTDARYQAVSLLIVVRDCEVATRWTPADRPFTITWRDEYDKVHMDSAGDFDQSTASSLVRYIDAACDGPLDR
jgi:hypothetical protein